MIFLVNGNSQARLKNTEWSIRLMFFKHTINERRKDVSTADCRSVKRISSRRFCSCLGKAALCLWIFGMPSSLWAENPALPPPESSFLQDETILPENALHKRRACMGTVFTLTVIPSAGVSREKMESALKGAFAEAEKLQSLASFFDADSELNKLNHTPVGEKIALSPDLYSLLARARQLAELSRGAFDPTLGAASRVWRRSRSRGTLPDAAELQKTRQQCGFQFLKTFDVEHSVARLRSGLLIDLGGIGKGAALDRMADYLKKQGIRCFRLSTTSDILVGDPPPGQKSWKVRLPHAQRVVELDSQAVSTAGTSNQYMVKDGVRYAHLIDPATGLGTTREVSVSVVSRLAATADAGATALIFLKQEARKPFCRAADISEFMITEGKRTTHENCVNE